MTTHKLAPIEPTEEMIEAGARANEERAFGWTGPMGVYKAMLSAAPPQEALAAPESLEELLARVPEFHCVNIWREEHKSFESNYGWICGLEDTRNAEALAFASTGRGKTPAEAIRNALEGK